MMAEKQAKVTRKDWDSDFFGIEIGTIDVSNFSEKQILDAIRTEFELIYIFSSTDIENLKFDYSSSLIELALEVDYSLELENNINILKAIGNVSDFELLKKLALQSGEFSRFAKDPRFVNNEYEKLYTEWITKSCNNVKTDVYVYCQESKICGFVTLEKESDCFSIGLLAVDNSQRGKGIGKALVDRCVLEAQKNRQNRIVVKTQGENIAAILLYQKKGFEIIKTSNVYHLWNM